MTDGLPPIDVWRWALAVLPIAVLVALVVKSRLPTSTNALITVAIAIVIGAAAFGAGPRVVGVGVAKGIWTGIWILYVIWPALLLYHLAARAGLSRMGGVFSSILPRRVENILIVAWIFPSFVQGVAGFGTPIAVAAPLLASMGVPAAMAVALPLIGYHWAVTFGSMGSSFYMGALTARLGGGEVEHYANDAAFFLGVNLIVSGVLVCLMFGGVRALRQGARMVVCVGALMAIAMFLAVQVEPAIGALAAGAAGFIGVGVLKLVTRREAVPVPVPEERALVTVGGADGGPITDDALEPVEPRRPFVVLLPYLYLLVMVLIVFVPAGSRAFAKGRFLIGPSFGETETTYGLVNRAVDHYTPIAAFGHPGSYILLASLLGFLTYRATRLWPRGELGDTVRAWLRQAWRSSLSVIALASVATVMVDTGMVRTIAVGAANVAGDGFPLVAPIIGLLGSFTTGSTTSSNALFSALQRDVAVLIGVRPSELLAAQTSGGNIGNSLAPVVILIGAAAVGHREKVSEIFRMVVPPAAALSGVLMALTMLLVALE
ncbi:MAG: L-lactate permease [Actinomycetota bacterium]